MQKTVECVLPVYLSSFSLSLVHVVQTTETKKNFQSLPEKKEKKPNKFKRKESKRNLEPKIILKNFPISKFYDFFVFPFCVTTNDISKLIKAEKCSPRQTHYSITNNEHHTADEANEQTISTISIFEDKVFAVIVVTLPVPRPSNEFNSCSINPLHSWFQKLAGSRMAKLFPNSPRLQSFFLLFTPSRVPCSQIWSESNSPNIKHTNSLKIE